MLVQNGLVREIREAQHVNEALTVTKTVTIRENAARKYRSWYDFCRTASSTLRLFMLKASGMTHLHNPSFTTRDDIQEVMATNIHPENAHINMANHGDAAQENFRAQLISSDFDRLFPHFVIQQKLCNMAVNEHRTLSGMMYVIYFNERTIYQTNVTMDVRLWPGNENGQLLSCNTTATVTKYSYNEFEVDAGNWENFRRFSLVQQLVNEWNHEGQADDPNQLVEEVEALGLEDRVVSRKSNSKI